MKTSSSLILIAAMLGLAPAGFGQVFTPQSTGAASSGGASPASGATSGSSAPSSGASPSSSSSSKGNDPIMGNVLPLFDPSTETVMFEGQMWDINDNRIFNARFEKYLNAPPADSADDVAYRATMDGIRQSLSPHNKAKGGRVDLNGAVALLEKASAYSQDGRMSESIANAVYRIWLARKQGKELQLANDRLRKSRSDTVRNAELSSRPSSLRPATSSRAPASGQAANQADKAEDMVGRLSAAGEYATRYAEIQAKITANEGIMAVSEVESKLEFQGLMVQFFAQRRFEHVVAATRIYTEFYNDGGGRLQFKEGSDAGNMFKDVAGFDPTVTSLDSLASEAIQDTAQAIEAFNFLIEKEERASASKRLMEAFMVGEFLPPVQTVSLEKKQSILNFVESYNQLLSALEVKDYALAEEKVTELRGLAGDFDHSKPMAAINTARLTSSMHVQTAVNEALRGNEQSYKENIAAATQIWPTNPELKTAFDSMSKQGNRQIQTINDLDRLIATRSFRQIHTDQGRYIAAVIDDPKRQEDLKQIITNITTIDISILQARKLAEVGNAHGAWETVEEVFKDFPDDPPLSKARSDYATEVSPFVSALKRAEDLEGRGQTGAGLAWFLKARQMYSASMFASRGIKRLVDEVLPDQVASGPAGQL
jgi:hypothetical protein